MGLMYKQDNLDILSFDLKPHLMKFVKKKYSNDCHWKLIVITLDNDEPLKKDNTNYLSQDDNFLDITLPAETVLTNPEDKQLYEEVMYLLHATVTSLNE